MEEDDEVAAAAAAQAAAAFQEQLMEEAEGQPGEEGDATEHAALQERWRQERLADEAQLLYDDSEEEGSSGSSGDGAGAAADAGLHWGLPLGLQACCVTWPTQCLAAAVTIPLCCLTLHCWLTLLHWLTTACLLQKAVERRPGRVSTRRLPLQPPQLSSGRSTRQQQRQSRRLPLAAMFMLPAQATRGSRRQPSPPQQAAPRWWAGSQMLMICTATWGQSCRRWTGPLIRRREEAATAAPILGSAGRWAVVVSWAAAVGVAAVAFCAVRCWRHK